MRLATRIAAGVLAVAAGIGLFALWLESGALFEEEVLEGLAGAPAPVSTAPQKLR
jgi:hypothetical protein